MKGFQRNKLALGVSLAIASSASLTSVTAVAQEEEKAIEEVVVTAGFRKSIIDSIDTKRNSASVVEAISAEDIGKLPDSSIAEAISRLPGLASQRLDGRSSSISIRGLGENFSTATFNGREQVSIGDNRGVEFDIYPSEIMAGVTVYKTPDASLSTQGIAGVIDMETVKPLNYDERTLQVNALYEMNDIGKLNPDGEDTGLRTTFSYIDQFNDGTLGVALAVAMMESPNNEERWNAWGYPTTDDGDYVIGGAKPFVRSSLLDRDTVMGVIQFEPSDELRIIADALYIDFTDEKILRGIEIPGWWGQGGPEETTTVGSVNNGFVESGTFNGKKVQVRNDFETRSAELNAVGFNLEYDISESLTVEFDYSHSEVDRTVWSLESYSSTGRGIANGPYDTIGWDQTSQEGIQFSPTFNYADYSLIQLGGGMNWGNGATVPSDGQDGFINIPEIEDELDTLKLALTKDLDDSVITRVEVGLNYSDREKTKSDSGIFLTLPAYPDMLSVPEEYRVGTASLDFIGMGDMIAYDSFRFWQDGNYTEVAEGLTVGARSTNDWTVSEEITIGYVKADFDIPVGDLTVMGNVGLQVVDTDQSSRGKAVQIVDGRVDFVDSTGGASYTEYLPSLNLTVAFSEESQLRFAAARTLSRSRMDRMNAGFSFGFDEVQNVPGGTPFTASGGNPELRPNTANQYDISYEYYFADDGYVSLAAYYKDLRTWQIQDDVPFDMADFVDPATLPGSINSTLGLSNVWVTSEGGEINGVEFTTSVPGRLLADALDGFGMIFSASFIDSSLETASGDEIDVPGLSDEIFNVTLFYEKNGFQARTSLRSRSDFQGERFGNSFTRETTTVVGADIIDAQIGFDFGEAGFEELDGLSISLQAQNLTDEPYTTKDGNGFVRDHQVFGTTYMIGAAYKF